MNPTRSTKATYTAAFLLGALIALLLNWPVRGAASPLPAGTPNLEDVRGV